MRKRLKVAASDEQGEQRDKNPNQVNVHPLVECLVDKKQVREDAYGDDGVALESDEEGEENRIGDRVPLWWYDNHAHVGYNLEGKRVKKALDLSGITKLLNDADDPDAWKMIMDVKNQTTYKLSPTDIEVIRRIRRSAFPLPSFDAEGPDSFVDFENTDAAIHPEWSTHPPKRQFVPSLWENKRINQLVNLIRRGKIRLNSNSDVSDVHDLWGASITESIDAQRGRVKGPPAFPAPKLPLPGHAESYNPPKEYLTTEAENAEWKSMLPEDREMDFIPNKYNCLREVPLYANNVLERFNRCLDLYLCPRSLKMKMNIDPGSLLPHLPSPKDLKPFPVSLSMSFDSSDDSPATHLSFDSTGSYLSVGRANGVVEIFEVPLSRRIARWKFAEDHDAMTTLTVFNPSLPILAVGIGTMVYILVVRLPSYFVEDGIGEEEEEGDSRRTPSRTRGVVPGAWDVLRALRSIQQASSHDRVCEDPLSVSATKPMNGSSSSSSSSLSDIWTPLDMSGLDPTMVLGGWTIAHRSAVHDIAWHPRGLYFTTVSTDAASPSLQLGIHSLSKLKTLRPFRKSVAGRVKRAVFHPINTSLLFVAFFKGVRLYSLQKSSTAPTTHQVGSLVKKLSGVDSISDMDIHPTGDHMIVGGINRRLTWFDLDLGSRPYKILRYHKSVVTTLGFHRAYPLMFSGAADGDINIFHAKVFSDLLSSPAIIPVKRLHPPSDFPASLSTLQGGTSPTVLRCQWHPTQPWLVVALQNGRVGLYA